MPQNRKKSSMRRPKKRIRWGYILLFLLIVVMMAALIGGVMVTGWIVKLKAELPEITQDDLTPDQTSYVYDKNGREIGKLHAGEDRVPAKLSDMPTFLIDALIATEDIRFNEHNGVDTRSVMRALMVDAQDSLKNKKLTFTQGASTITMQLVRNVVADTEKTLDRKVKEALAALQFEKNFDKDEILELYMNMIYLGPRTYGFNSAAKYYFNKELRDITLSEAALMVGVLRNASYYSPYHYPDRALGVRNTVLNNLIIYDEEKYGDIAKAAMEDEMELSETQDNTGTDYSNPWFVDYVLNEATGILKDLEIPAESLFTGGLRVYTTMDPLVQGTMENAYEDDDNFHESKTGDLVESGMAVVKVSTGEICGLVGGRNYGTKRGFSRASSMQRSPGSTIKPVVVYGPALDNGYGPGSVIDDSPLTGSYSPNNSDRAFHGRITLRRAVMGSRNVPAVKVLQAIGTQVGWSYAIKMGLPLSEEDAYYSSIALGGITRGVAPLDMAGAFATFGNGGIYTKPYSVAKIVDSRGNIIYEVDLLQRQQRVVSEQAAYLMTDILISAVNSGTGTNARLKNWPAAGKTGTVELPKEDPDYRGKSGHKDIWFAGYTPDLAAVVWMGYDNKKDADGNIQYLPNVFGGGKPAQLWKLVMTAWNEAQDEVRQFDKPNGLASIAIDTKTGLLPSSLTPAEFRGSELFNAKDVPTQESDIWQVVEICADSGSLAREFCPNKTTSVRMVVDLPEGATISSRVSDYHWYAPQSYCSLHTVSQGNLSSVYICTDPRHGTERVLAKVPSFGSSGGCPQEFIALRYYGEAYLPTRYCGLDDHALVVNNNSTPFLPPVFEGGENHPETSGPENPPSGPTEISPPDAIVSTPTDNSYATDENGAPILQTPYSLATYPSSNGCLLSWSANNDPATTMYIIQKVVDGDTANHVRHRVAGAYSFNDPDVREGHVYTYSIYAYNEEYRVTSGWSQSVSFTL